MELKCAIQSYAWGKRGTSSTVSSLMKSANTDFVLRDNEPYAELWMGTHPNGPSVLKSSNISLNEYIEENSHVLGTKSRVLFENKLPFLFKVLSIKKALSIQVHPNKKQAVELHATQPQIYKDPNHKPELAIALTPFEALCGFRPISEIKQYLRALPELSEVIGESKVHRLATTDEVGLPDALKLCFTSLMAQESEIIAQQLKKLLARLTNLDEATRQILNADLFERLYTDFPGDVGCFGIYIFNYITLQPGEAIFLGPNEPHAYLSGDCVECMACSDNVIRAGLTPKMKDVETLVEMLSYISEPASAKRFQPTREDECTDVFCPPIPDFAVAKITIPPGKIHYTLISRDSASILIVIAGKAETETGSKSVILNRGSVVFIPANETVAINILDSSQTTLMFQAFAKIV